MKELTNIYKEAGQQFVDDLFKDYLLVTEKLSGSTFSFERHGDNIKFFKGSNRQPINLVDRTLMMYYEPAIQYILSQTENNLEDLPEYWRFCFQYFIHNQPGAIEYDNLPKNGLILTHIQIRNAKGKIAKVIEDPRVLRDWASAFQVTPLIPIFSGYLKEEQKRKIREFLSTPKEDHLEIFGTSSFAKYLITSLNPTITQTTLQNNLDKPIDSIIFKFFKQGTKQVFAAKMIDPYTEALMKEREPIDLRRAPADINEILLLDILAFIEERGLRGGELLTATSQERYLELMSNLFNDYVAKRGVDLQKLDIKKANFAKGPEFNLNLNLIRNNRTKEILQKSESLQNLYKIIVGSLRKKRNPERVGSVMTKSVVEDFNKMVDKITDAINKETDGEFKTFGDYLNTKVTEEIDHKDLEELVVEEKVLNYNNFINLGKIVLEEKGKTLVKNKKTGDEYEVKKPDPKKHEIVEPGDKSNNTDEPVKKLTGLNKVNDLINRQIADIKDPGQKAEAKRVGAAMNTINDPDAPQEEKVKLFGELVEDGILKKNAGGTKFYTDTAKTGLARKILGDKKSPTALINVAEEYGLDNIEKESSDRINKKQMTGAKLFGDKIVKTKVGTTKEGVSFDGVDYNKQPIPDIKKLEEIYGSKEEADLAKASLEKYNSIIEKAQDSFSGDNEMETLSAFPDTPPTTPANRKKLKDSTADIVADGFVKQFDGKELSKSQQKVVDDLKGLKDIKDPKEYDEKIMLITGDIMKDEFLTTGAADVVEMVSYMRELNKGNNAYMPAASNYPLGDIISISPEKINFEKDSPEEIQRKMQLIMTSVEARSIKKGAGGASASGAKTNLSEYKPFKNSKGETIDPKVIKEDLTQLSDKEKLYSGIYSDDPKISKEAGKTITDLAKKYDIDLTDPKYEKRRNKSVNSAIANIKRKNPDVDEDMLKERLTNYYNLGEVYEATYNETVKSQLFTNEVWDYDKKTGKATVDKTDGICKIAKLNFSFSTGSWGASGKPGNPVPTRFKNVNVC